LSVLFVITAAVDVEALTPGTPRDQKYSTPNG